MYLQLMLLNPVIVKGLLHIVCRLQSWYHFCKYIGFQGFMLDHIRGGFLGYLTCRPAAGMLCLTARDKWKQGRAVYSLIPAKLKQYD